MVCQKITFKDKSKKPIPKNRLLYFKVQRTTLLRSSYDEALLEVSTFSPMPPMPVVPVMPALSLSKVLSSEVPLIWASPARAPWWPEVLMSLSEPGVFIRKSPESIEQWMFAWSETHAVFCRSQIWKLWEYMKEKIFVKRKFYFLIYLS